MAFTFTSDKNLSPYTGLTRESWIEAGIYLLEGCFNNIPSFEHPVVLPRKDTKVTYPHLDAPESEQAQQRLAEIFEGLTRTFFIASVIIHERPDLTINNIKLRDYYKKHVLRVVDPEDELFVGSYESLKKLTGTSDPTRPYQQTVETCALVIGLWLSKEEIWDTYTKEEKDLIASFLKGFANASTVPQNWRLFNMLDLAFLHMNGYEIDKSIMTDHATEILNYYVGDGWYRDGQCFDYYSCWAFNMYAPLWNIWYGYENLPYIAKKFEKHSNALMKTYCDFFDKDGFTNMWGRSNIYRFASTSAFAGNLLLENSHVDPGLARRIASGSLLQFLERDDFLYKGVPTLGFYGEFKPLVQGYSCAESPYWIGKAFMFLHFGKDHPFWSEKENNGTWDKLSKSAVKETTLDGPALCFTNHAANGETILRTGKIRKAKNDLHGMWNYSKLSYNTKFPWESTPLMDKETGLKTGDVESEAYVIKDITTDRLLYGNTTFWCGEKDEVLYRRLFFDFEMENENHWNQAINLADFPVSKGIMRVDRLRLYRKPVIVTLGSYGFPNNETTVKVLEKGKAKAIVLKGKDATGTTKQLAMTIYNGFDELNITHSKGSNPDSENSIVVYATAKRDNMYDAKAPYVLISQVITSESDEDFKESEIFPIDEITYEDEFKTGSYGNVIIKLNTGDVKEINYSKIERNLSL
ncbi:MAG: DUF2264 domain-containing protein [Lachnospiraceae bacterium]|nr:DUF2264 domain-containing protein [Lachnospiraceae bacterium]